MINPKTYEFDAVIRKVDGIDGEVDLNICFTGIADYA